MLGTNHKHLYRHFSGGRLIEDRAPKGMRDVEYLGYICTTEYDGMMYRSYIRAANVSERLLPTWSELQEYERQWPAA